eukprot:evm.model.scf_2120EXC.3 EVM.evm.TU.scf_2120EXC.3   scf_2120EXC:10457-15838(+)
MVGSTQLEDLNPQCLKAIFRYLRGDECAQAACIARVWRDASHSDDLWDHLLQRDFPAEAPRQAGEAPREKYKDLYCLRRRTRVMWAALKGWCDEHARAVAKSLLCGATEEEINRAERQLGVKFPAALRDIYRYCNGQKLHFDDCLDQDIRPIGIDRSVFAGLFGGYSVYEHVVCTRMLSLKRMVRWTQWYKTQGTLKEDDTRVVFAASYLFTKAIFVDTQDCSVLALTHNRKRTLRMCPDDPYPGSRDGVLRWMETYTEALNNGVYKVAPILPPDDVMNDPRDAQFSNGINLFPMKEPALVSACTHGVQVRSSSLFLPELSEFHEDGMPSYTFGYCVRFSLQPKQGHGRPEYSHVQLRSRHWVIRDASGAVESRVNGLAVIGQFPVLKAGGQEFCYQSCTRQQESSGSMEGHFSFVDVEGHRGSLDLHTEPPTDLEDFGVACPRFTVQIPDIIF